MKAKDIINEICDAATIVPRCTIVRRTVQGIRISLCLTSLKEGTWTVRMPDGEAFRTSSVFEAEIKLEESLQKVEVI